MNGKILQINSICTDLEENTIHISGIILKIIKEMFTYPSNSAPLKMWRVKKTSDTIVTQPLSYVLQKMVTFVITDNKEKIYTMPLLHT